MNKAIRTLLLINILALSIAFFWNSMPFVKDLAHSVLDPTAGRLFDWSANYGIIVVAFLISLIISLLQKYTTDQKLLRELRAEQKFIQEESKKYREHPEKLMEFQKKQMEFFWKSFEITARPALYTAIPFILLFRWFTDYFAIHTVKIFGFMGWIWAYLLLSIIFSMIFRKLFKLA